MLANKDGFVMAEVATGRLRFLLAVGLLTLLCSVCEGKHVMNIDCKILSLVYAGISRIF